MNFLTVPTLSTPFPAAMTTEFPPPPKPKIPFHKMLWKEWIKPVGTVLLLMIVVRSSVIDWNDVPSGSMLPTIQIGDRVVVNKLAYGVQIPMGGPYIEVPLTPWRFKNPLRDVPMIRWGSGPARGDIVTFWSPNVLRDGSVDGRRLIKRVVAVPGDTLEVREGVVYLNNKPTAFTETGTGRTETVVRESGERDTRPVRDGIEQADASPAHYVQFIDGRPNLRDMAPVTLKPDQYFCMGDDRDDSGDARVWARQNIFLNREQITGHAFGVAWSLDGWSPRGDRFFKKLK